MKKIANLGNKGFSLVELIIVIAIMAILVGVLAPNLIRYIERTNISADTQVADTIRTAFITAMMDPAVVNEVPSGTPALTSLEKAKDTAAGGFGTANGLAGLGTVGGAFADSVAQTLGFDDNAALQTAITAGWPNLRSNPGNAPADIRIRLTNNNAVVTIWRPGNANAPFSAAGDNNQHITVPLSEGATPAAKSGS